MLKINLVKINTNAKEILEISRRAIEESSESFVLKNLYDWRRMITRNEPEQNEDLTAGSNDSFNKRVKLI